MRLVGSLTQLQLVEKFSKLLTENGILFSAESEENLDWGSNDYGTITWSFWVHEEQDLSRAKLLLLEAVHSPVIPAPLQQEPTSITALKLQKKTAIFGTQIFLSLCISIFILNALSRYSPANPHQYASSPVQAALLFDYPKAFQNNCDKITTPFFPGYLPLIEYSRGNIAETSTIASQLPKFEKIKEGQIWRLVSPAFLHSDIFHILFNMFWLLILGRPLERLFGFRRFILFSLAAALLSNVAQYMVSGAHFLGFSGIIAAYAGYIFANGRENPKSPLSILYEPTRFIFGVILFFAALSFLEFGLMMTIQKSLPITIANTAHMTGFLFGYLLSKKSYHNKQEKMT